MKLGECPGRALFQQRAGNCFLYTNMLDSCRDLSKGSNWDIEADRILEQIPRAQAAWHVMPYWDQSSAVVGLPSGFPYRRDRMSPAGPYQPNLTAWPKVQFKTIGTKVWAPVSAIKELQLTATTSNTTWCWGLVSFNSCWWLFKAAMTSPLSLWRGACLGVCTPTALENARMWSEFSTRV